MHYGAALPAGNYHGSLGRYAGRPQPSSQGASMRGYAKAQVLSGVGLGGLGAGVDFCDPGWSAFANILGATGSLITATNSASVSAGAAAKGATPDAGWGAAGSGATAVGTVWGNTCTNQAAQRAGEAQTAFNNQLAQQRLEQEMAIANARMQNEMQLGARRDGGGMGVSNQTLMIGAAAVGVVVLGALLLRKK